MSEKRLLSQTRVVCLLCLFLVGAALRGQAASSSFNCEIFLGGATGRTLCFGVAASAEEAVFEPYPPNSPAGDIYLLGRYEDSAESGDLVEDFFTLSDDVRFLDGAQAATWTLVAKQTTKVRFKLAEGNSLPAGAVLKFAGEKIAFDTPVDVQGGQRYAITYQANGDVPPAPEQPENIVLQMVKVKGNTIETNVGATTILDGTYAGASIKDGVLTYVVDGREADKVQLAIVNEVAGVRSAPATVLITFTEGIAMSVVSPSFVTLKAGDEEGGATTVVQYKLFVGAGVKKDALKMVLTLPAWKTMKADPFPYTAVVTSGGEALETSVASAEDKSKLSFTLPLQPEQSSYDLSVTLTAGNDAESKNMVLEAAAGELTASVIGPYIYIEGSGTLDFDGNGLITTEDAIMFYNFVNQQGQDIPELFDGPDGLAMLTDGIVVEPTDAENCRQFMQTVPAFLDFDEDGVIDTNDAIMLYNFTNQQGQDVPELFDGPYGIEMLTDGIVVDPVRAETARDKFQQMVR